MITRTKILLFAIAMFVSGTAIADTASKPFKATATLSNSCRLATTDVIFGEYNPTDTADKESNQKVNIFCTKGTAWTFYTSAADNYLSYGASTTNGIKVTTYNQYANMLSGAEKLLYQVKAQTGVWTADLYYLDTNKFAYAYTGIGTGADQSIFIPYKIIKNQYVKPGNFVDTVTAYILF